MNDIVDVAKVAEVVEAARTSYLEGMQQLLRKTTEAQYSMHLQTQEAIYKEIEAGSKELAIYREMHMLLSHRALSAAKFEELSQRLSTLREEREAYARELATPAV